MEKYCEMIRNLREDNHLGQDELAKILGTSQQMYSRYENGHNELPIRHLLKLVSFYKTSADYILGISQQNNIYGEYEKLPINQKEKINIYIKGLLDK